MGKKWSNAPVYYTVVQIQFNPILDMQSFMPKIQSRMRAAGFPDYKQDIVQQIEFPFGISNQSPASQPTITQQHRYFFGDVEGREIFLLETNALSFQTSQYETFDALSETFIKGMSIVHDILNLNYFERIGVRYFDAVIPKTDENLSQYLVSEVLGLSNRKDVELLQSYSETQASINAVRLISRVVVRKGQIGLPQELASPAPAIDSRFLAYTGLHAILDNDAFMDKRSTFTLEVVKQNLSTLHTEISNSFKASITDFAIKTWA